MHDASNAATGTLIKSYGYGKGLQIFLGLFAAGLLGFAGYVGYLSTIVSYPGQPKNPASNITFNGSPNLFYYVMGFFLLLALVMVGTMVWQKKLRDARYEVYEKGIRQITSKHDAFIPFTEMDDLYLFASGQTLVGGLINNLAYRRNASESFRRANAHLHQLEEFIALVRERHVEERLPLAIETLTAGGAVHFSYADTKQVWGKRMSGNFLDVVTKPLIVTRQTLEVEGRRFPIAMLRDADLSNWTEKVVIKDNDGHVVLSTVATGIMSMDVFLNVMAWLRQEQVAPSAAKWLLTFESCEHLGSGYRHATHNHNCCCIDAGCADQRLCALFA